MRNSCDCNYLQYYWLVELPQELLKYSDAIDALRAIGRVRWAVMDVIGKQVAEQEDIPFDCSRC